MLSLARTLMGAPSLIVIDEPMEGLAPRIVAQVVTCLAALKAKGVAMLLIEQRGHVLLRDVVDRSVQIERGSIVHTPAS